MFCQNFSSAYIIIHLYSGISNVLNRAEQNIFVAIIPVYPFIPAGLTGDPGPECRSALRGLAMSRADDLRAELLRAEHLKAEVMVEENSDGSR